MSVGSENFSHNWTSEFRSLALFQTTPHHIITDLDPTILWARAGTGQNLGEVSGTVWVKGLLQWVWVGPGHKN